MYVYVFNPIMNLVHTLNVCKKCKVILKQKFVIYLYELILSYFYCQRL